jgi:hypothetical protein
MRRLRSSDGSASRAGIVGVLVAILLAGLAGCSSENTAIATNDPVAKLRLERLLKFYQMYTNEKKKPPTNEQVFKDYIRALPKEHKEGIGATDDVESILVSPRDKQKYHFQYGMMARPDGPNRALAWEETGQDGKRYVALTIGYVQLYDEDGFQNAKKKK